MFVLLVAAFIAAAVGYSTYSYRKLNARYGVALAEYNSQAFKELIEPSPEGRYLYVTKLASEVTSIKGVKAVPMVTQSRGTALHQINKDGTFSTKGPYFVSWRSGNWGVTGTTHLVKVLRGKQGWGFKPDHYKQDGLIIERGVAILEYNTKRYRPLGLREFAQQQINAQQRVPAK